MRSRNRSIVVVLAGIIVISMFCSSVGASPSSAFSGWTQFASDNNDGPFGGQPYDHEYMFWKIDGNSLSIGVQSGFNLSTGRVGDYYLGDLALSFDGSTSGSGGSGYEYAYDFGLKTKDWYYTGPAAYWNADADADGIDGSGDGIDNPGLYSVTTWNNNTKNAYHNGDAVAPFAMDGGSIVANALSSINGYDNIVGSYYRIAEFDVSGLLNPDGSLAVAAHIAMSCGNDVMNGSFYYPGEPGEPGPASSIPEPSTIALLGVGLAGLAGGAARRRMKKKKEEK